MRNHNSLSTMRLSRAAFPALYFCKMSFALRMSSSPITCCAGSSGSVVKPFSPTNGASSKCLINCSNFPPSTFPLLFPDAVYRYRENAFGAARRPRQMRKIKIKFRCICPERTRWAFKSFHTLITRVRLLRLSMSSGSSFIGCTGSVFLGLMGFSISTYRHSS